MFINKIEKFTVEATVLNLTNGESFNASTYITDINVRKDFISTSFPLVVINMMTTDEYRNIMRDNDVSIRLKVNKYTDVNTENTQDTEEIVIEDIVLDTVIRSYKKPYTTGNFKTEDDNEQENNVADTVKLIPFQIVGIPEDLIQKNTLVINEIYENARMDDILVNILSKVETDKIFMDPSDNFDREEALIIPPMNIVPAIKYLQEVYGIYNAGISLFFDFEGTYLIKTFAEQRQYLNSLEILSVPINDATTGIEYTSTQYDEENNMRLYLQTPPPFVETNNISMDLLGQTTVFNSYSFDFETVRRIYEQDTNNNKIRYFWNQYQNKLVEESFINETLRTRGAIAITLKSTSPSYFSMATLFRVNTQSNYVNGDYTPLEMSYTFYTKDYKSYDSLINIKLSKK
jgi:hypothetical protein